MLTQWAIALQSCDFSVEHKPGKLNVIPNTLSRLFNLEYNEMGSHHIWLPFVGTYPTTLPYMDRPDEAYQGNLHNLDEIQLVESDRELFTSAADVFMSIDSETLRQAQQAKFRPYFEYLSDPK